MNSKQKQISDLTILKELLIGTEQQSIEGLVAQTKMLERKLLDKKENTRHFSEMIAETIQTRIEKDNDLQKVLKPIIRETLYEMVENDPNFVTTALLNAFRKEQSE